VNRDRKERERRVKEEIGEEKDSEKIGAPRV
jgi:hypothetical protein